MRASRKGVPAGSPLGTDRLSIFVATDGTSEGHWDGKGAKRARTAHTLVHEPSQPWLCAPTVTGGAGRALDRQPGQLRHIGPLADLPALLGNQDA
jgi:hypothetical protein